MGSWSNENTYSNKIDTIYKYIRGILKNMSLSSLNDKFSFLWVLIFANLTSRNISRIFDFVKMAKKHEIHEKMYLPKLELLKQFLSYMKNNICMHLETRSFLFSKMLQELKSKLNLHAMFSKLYQVLFISITTDTFDNAFLTWNS